MVSIILTTTTTTNNERNAYSGYISAARVRVNRYCLLSVVVFDSAAGGTQEYNSVKFGGPLEGSRMSEMFVCSHIIAHTTNFNQIFKLLQRDLHPRARAQKWAEPHKYSVDKQIIATLLQNFAIVIIKVKGCIPAIRRYRSRISDRMYFRQDVYHEILIQLKVRQNSPRQSKLINYIM